MCLRAVMVAGGLPPCHCPFRPAGVRGLMCSVLLVHVLPPQTFWQPCLQVLQRVIFSGHQFIFKDAMVREQYLCHSHPL